MPFVTVVNKHYGRSGGVHTNTLFADLCHISQIRSTITKDGSDIDPSLLALLRSTHFDFQIQFWPIIDTFLIRLLKRVLVIRDVLSMLSSRK